MTKSNPGISSTCAVMVCTGAMLLLTTHHAGPTDVMSIKWVHISLDTIALALIACPIVSWLTDK